MFWQIPCKMPKPFLQVNTGGSTYLSKTWHQGSFKNWIIFFSYFSGATTTIGLKLEKVKQHKQRNWPPSIKRGVGVLWYNN